MENEYLWRQSRGVLLALLIPTGIAFFRRDLFARLYFAAVAWFTAFMTVAMVLGAAGTGSLENNVAWIATLAALVIA